MSGNFNLYTRYVNYTVNYYTITHGIVKYEYRYDVVEDQVLEDIGTVIMIGGTAVVVVYSGGTVPVPVF